MGIRKVEVEGQKCFEVSVSVRSKLNPKIRVQKKKRRISSLREAQAMEKELLIEAAAEVSRLEGSGVPWNALLEKYELKQRFGQGTFLRKVQVTTIWDNIAVLRRFTPHWKRRFAIEITTADVRHVMEEMLEQGYSKARLRALKVAINSIYKWGIESGAIVGVRVSPAMGIQLGRYHEDKPPMILSLLEIQRLLEEAKASGSQWYPIWFMALHTGMRSGELFALEWSDIDFEAKLITVSKSYNGRMKVTKSTKAGYWRKVPMSAEVESMVVTLRAKRRPDDLHVLPRIPQWRRGEAARVLREFCTGVGISAVSFHTLRACFATHLLNSGVTSPVVKKICGWTDDKVMNRYIRLAGIDVRGATEGLNFVRPERQGVEVVNLSGFRAANKYVPLRDKGNGQ